MIIYSLFLLTRLAPTLEQARKIYNRDFQTKRGDDHCFAVTRCAYFEVICKPDFQIAPAAKRGDDHSFPVTRSAYFELICNRDFQIAPAAKRGHDHCFAVTRCAYFEMISKRFRKKGEFNSQ